MSIKLKIFLNSIITALIGVSIMFIVGVCGVRGLNNRGNLMFVYLFIFGCISVIVGTFVGIFLNRKIILAIDELKKMTQNITRSELGIEEKSIEEETVVTDDFEDIKESLTELSNEIDNREKSEKVKLDLIDINEILFEISVMFEKKSYKKGVKFQFFLPKDPIKIRGHINSIKQVIMNVYDNAIKYSFNGGLITVGVSNRSLNDIRVYIKDNGIGISEEELPTIFKDKYEGEETLELGLGLSYSKKIMMEHGGDIIINSTEGEGTEVILQFKIHEEIKNHSQDNITECKNDNSEEGNNIHDDLIIESSIELDLEKQTDNEEREGDCMKNKKETKTLENNLSNNAMMMDNVFGSAPNPFKNKMKEKREHPIPENESNIIEKERAWTEDEEEEKK